MTPPAAMRGNHQLKQWLLSAIGRHIGRTPVDGRGEKTDQRVFGNFSVMLPPDENAGRYMRDTPIVAGVGRMERQRPGNVRPYIGAAWWFIEGNRNDVLGPIHLALLLRWSCFPESAWATTEAIVFRQ